MLRGYLKGYSYSAVFPIKFEENIGSRRSWYRFIKLFIKKYSHIRNHIVSLFTKIAEYWVPHKVLSSHVKFKENIPPLKVAKF